MCFNKESSIIAFTIGIVCSYLLIKKANKLHDKYYILVAVLLILISIMQLIEFFLWLNQKCNNTNYIFSLLIIVLLWAQPFITYIAYTYIYKKKIPQTHKVILTIWTLLMLLVLYLCSQQNMCSLADKDSCRLIWNPFTFIKENYIVIFILMILFYFYIFNLAFHKIKNSTNTRAFLVILIGVIISLLYYKGKKWYTIFGSIYCFFCVFYGIVELLF